MCDISERPSDKLEKVLQMVNPFSNKHHNIKVRGFLSSNSNFEVGPILHLVNLCTTFESHIPFVYNRSTKPDPTTFLILPEIANLALLAQVYARLRMNLKDIGDKLELSTSTNLRGIRRISDTYALAITLFHNIYYRFTLETESNNESSWDFAPLDGLDKIHRQVTRWVIIPFVRKQNIRFGNFHVVEIETKSVLPAADSSRMLQDNQAPDRYGNLSRISGVVVKLEVFSMFNSIRKHGGFCDVCHCRL